MTITPVAPLAGSQLVVDTQAVIIDITDTYAIRVEVDSVEVWNDGLGFQNGWSGSYIIISGTHMRLVCDPPAPFTIGTNHSVYVLTDAENLTYTFRVSLEKLTTEADLSSPQIVQVDTYTWSARVHNNEDPGGLPAQFDGPGNVYLQVLDPRGSEVLAVPGNEVGLVWDEGRNKVIIYFIRNETVFYMEADPGDTPATKGYLRNLEATVRLAPNGEGDYHHEDASFPPIKKAMVESAVVKSTGGDGTWVANYSPYNAAPTPEIRSGGLDGPPVFLRMLRPTEDLESELLIGYYIVKFIGSTPSIIGFVEMAPEDYNVDFYDTNLTLGASYAVMGLYHLYAERDALGNPINLSAETRVGEIGAKAAVRSNLLSVLEPVEYAGYGEGSAGLDEGLGFVGESFPPLKLAVIQQVTMARGGEGYLYWADSSFAPIGT